MGLAAKINRGARRTGQRWLWGIVGELDRTRYYAREIYGRGEASPHHIPP